MYYDRGESFSSVDTSVEKLIFRYQSFIKRKSNIKRAVHVYVESNVSVDIIIY